MCVAYALYMQAQKMGKDEQGIAKDKAVLHVYFTQAYIAFDRVEAESIFRLPDLFSETGIPYYLGMDGMIATHNRPLFGKSGIPINQPGSHGFGSLLGYAGDRLEGPILGSCK